MAFFDPNSIFNENNGVVDQSDLTTFVNLSVSIPRRIINTLPSPSTTETSYNSIMMGSEKEGVSTSYVDITFNNDDDGIRNRELFGVTDICIEFDTSYHPLVKMNFTDIKGSALFNPSSTASLNLHIALMLPVGIGIPPTNLINGPLGPSKLVFQANRFCKRGLIAFNTQI